MIEYVRERNCIMKLFDINKMSKVIGDVVNEGAKIAGDVTNTVVKSVENTAQNIMSVADKNGNGQVDIEDIIIMGLSIPHIQVNRRDFLQKEFMKRYSQEVIDEIIAYNPAYAKIPAEVIDEIANDVIQYERNCVSGISAALGIPGGFTMAATIPADMAQFYGYMLRTAQKLMYLYGFPEIDITQKGSKFDSATLNMLTICLGVMYGTAGANKAIKMLAKGLANGVEKKLIKTALTKGTIYPIVKSVSKWFGMNMTKKVFAGFFSKAIPVVGGVIGGGITYVTFKPCCDKLKESLQDTYLSNPNHKETFNEDIIVVEEE